MISESLKIVYTEFHQNKITSELEKIVSHEKFKNSFLSSEEIQLFMNTKSKVDQYKPLSDKNVK